jgi:phosphatidylinositol alpha-mannosyltransferase
MYHCKLPLPGRKPGGVEVFVHRLANVLQDRGHDVTVLTFSERPPDARYDVTRLRPRASEESKVLRQYVAPWLFNLRSFDGMDVVHTHGDDWFWLRRRVPTVRTFHGSALNEARAAQTLRRRVDQSVIFGLELVARKRATAAYAVGPDAGAIYATDGVLATGIDIPEAPERRGQRPAILFVGTWGGRKRGELLQRIFTDEVRPRHPDAELWMVADHCDPAPGVVWHRSPSDEELRELYARAWVFCLPSRYEGFGIPYLEAMAAGAPVVATPNSGASMLLAGGAGLLVERDEDLGPTLAGLLADPERRAQLATDGRIRAESYAWPRVAERYEEVYARAISGWRATRRRGDSPRASVPPSAPT